MSGKKHTSSMHKGERGTSKPMPGKLTGSGKNMPMSKMAPKKK